MYVLTNVNAQCVPTYGGAIIFHISVLNILLIATAVNLFFDIIVTTFIVAETNNMVVPTTQILSRMAANITRELVVPTA